MTINGGDIGLIVSLLNLVGLIYFLGVWKGQIDVKVNTIWETFVMNARTDARQAGVIKQNSPLALRPDVHERLAMLGPKLIEVYDDSIRKRMSESGIVLLFSKKFGDELIEQVCIPLQINFGSALTAAVQYCKEQVETRG